MLEDTRFFLGFPSGAYTNNLECLPTREPGHNTAFVHVRKSVSPNLVHTLAAIVLVFYWWPSQMPVAPETANVWIQIAYVLVSLEHVPTVDIFCLELSIRNCSLIDIFHHVFTKLCLVPPFNRRCRQNASCVDVFSSNVLDRFHWIAVFDVDACFEYLWE